MTGTGGEKTERGAIRQFGSTFMGLWGIGCLLGIARAAWLVSGFGYADRGLDQTAQWAWRRFMADGTTVAFWVALAPAIVWLVAVRWEPDSRRRRRLLMVSVPIALAILVGELIGGAAWARPRLGGAMAGEIGLGMILGSVVLPALADAARIPRLAIAGALTLDLIAGFALARALIGNRPWFRPAEDERPPSFFSRRFGLLGSAFFVATLAVFVQHRPSTAPKDAPNIVLISIDTLRADHLPFYGYDRDTAPALGRLAVDGVVVDRLVSHAPWTLPSHLSMFTGQRPYQHGVTAFQNVPDQNLTLLGEVLKNRGYQTGGFVTNILLSAVYGFSRGFDDYRLLNDAHAERVVNEAARWWRLRKGARFLFVHLYDAHYPYDPPERFRGRFGRKDDGLDELMKKPFLEFGAAAKDFDPVRTADVVGRYDEEILGVDRALDSLFHTLGQDADWNKTWVLVTADHGEEFGDHGMWGHSVTLYEEMLRVPLVIKPPGESCAGSRYSPAMEQRALFDLIGAVAAGDIDGGCVAGEGPVFLDRFSASEAILSETEVFGPHRFAAERNGKKLIEPIKVELPSYSVDRDYEAYDLDADPGERTNLYPGVPPGLTAAINAARADRAQAMADRGEEDKDRSLSPEELQRLRALGYLQ